MLFELSLNVFYVKAKKLHKCNLVKENKVESIIGKSVVWFIISMLKRLFDSQF